MIILPIVLILALLAIVVLVVRGLSEVNVNERFPPIDDDEFVRRCGPGVRRDTALRVRRALSDALGIDYARIYPEQSLVRDLDCE